MTGAIATSVTATDMYETMRVAVPMILGELVGCRDRKYTTASGRPMLARSATIAEVTWRAASRPRPSVPSVHPASELDRSPRTPNIELATRFVANHLRLLTPDHTGAID